MSRRDKRLTVSVEAHTLSVEDEHGSVPLSSARESDVTLLIRLRPACTKMATLTTTETAAPLGRPERSSALPEGTVWD